MERWVGRFALVTGASSGIGQAVARSLVTHGVHVIGCGRDLARLEDLAGKMKSEGAKGTVFPRRCDLRNEEDILSMFEDIKKNHGRLDICVNNSGVLNVAPLLSGSTEKWREMLEVNVLALSICTREAVKLMRETGVTDGQLVNMCSMSGHRQVKGKGMAVYQATKCAVRVLTEAVRIELREVKSNIRISEISPGLVQTELFDRSGGQDHTKNFKQPLLPEDIADSVIYVLSAPPHVQVHDVLIRAIEQVS